ITMSLFHLIAPSGYCINQQAALRGVQRLTDAGHQVENDEVIRFLKHLERCRVLLHLIDIDPIDGSDPVENARIIIGELEKNS
ncbi:hypothetical protein ONK20_25970, partial [Salmonella enterica subsp. enterica serovar Montevideo]|nr:hypothetical protein [Salmonella enterica subsp. enterica serovar Montevideo]